MVHYRERLLPSITNFAICLLLIPATLLVFAPINFTVGIFVAIALYLGSVVLFIGWSPVIEVTSEELRVGRAHISVALLGGVSWYRGEEAFAERGPKLDARAFVCLRGWAPGVVKVCIEDPDDPTPYWLASTRHPERLTEAIETARDGARNASDARGTATY